MASPSELRRHLLNREIALWVEEGKERSGDRLDALVPASDEADTESAWQEHCLARMNSAAWELNELEGRGSQHPDAQIVNIEDWRSR